MAQAPKRLPGAPNPAPRADAPNHVARESLMGGHGHGLARGIVALLEWRRRRKADKGRPPA